MTHILDFILTLFKVWKYFGLILFIFCVLYIFLLLYFWFIKRSTRIPLLQINYNDLDKKIDSLVDRIQKVSFRLPKNIILLPLSKDSKIKKMIDKEMICKALNENNNAQNVLTVFDNQLRVQGFKPGLCGRDKRRPYDIENDKNNWYSEVLFFNYFHRNTTETGRFAKNSKGIWVPLE